MTATLRFRRHHNSDPRRRHFPRTGLVSWLSGLAALLLSTALQADTVHVAVAANFAPAMKEIAASFGRHTGHEVMLSSASSGKLAAQIQHGAPFDIFLSADQAKPLALAKAGYAVPATRFTYAIGALVLWSADEAIQGSERQRLQAGDYRKLAIANPRLAPYGKAARETLQALGLEAASRRHWVTGENIAQTYQFVASGNAELGFVALSQLRLLIRGSAPDPEKANQQSLGWQVPSAMHRAIRQDAILLSKAESNGAANQLLDYLKGEDARAIMRDFGYDSADDAANYSAKGTH